MGWHRRVNAASYDQREIKSHPLIFYSNIFFLMVVVVVTVSPIWCPTRVDRSLVVVVVVLESRGRENEPVVHDCLFVHLFCGWFLSLQMLSLLFSFIVVVPTLHYRSISVSRKWHDDYDSWLMRRLGLSIIHPSNIEVFKFNTQIEIQRYTFLLCL